MRPSRLLALGALALGAAVTPTALAGTPRTSLPPGLTVETAVHHDTSRPLSEIAKPFVVVPGHLVVENRQQLAPARSGRADTVRQVAATTAPRARLIANHRGLGDNYPGFTVNAIPPDTVGAVGPTQYFQWVNSGFVIIDKKSGRPLLGPSNGNAIWEDFGGECEKRNDGDPIVNYDRWAKRWVVQQFAVTDGNYQCVAVSTTSNALGRYHRYAFKYKGFNDYPKTGVWSHSYINTYNMFDAEAGPKVCALERAAMLAGRRARQQCAQLSVSHPALLPADADGRLAPAGTAPAPLIALATDALQLRSFAVSWASPSQTRLSAPATLRVAPFDSACLGYEIGSRITSSCVPQPGASVVGMATSLGLDPLSDRPMFRLAWRRFAAGYEAMVVTHSVSALPSAAGIRWYELRRTGGRAWTVHQQGTYAPDTDSRWMGSAAMDKNGGIAVGYSVSGPTTTFPGIRIAGRTARDPKGTLSRETKVVDGFGVQTTASLLARWGDYSAMSVDPVDDCTLWYTTQYMESVGIFNWSSRIAAVRLPGC